MELEPVTTTPKVVDAAAATEPSKLALSAVTCSPVCVTVASHELVTVSAVSANVNPAVQPVSSVDPLLVTVSWSW